MHYMAISGNLLLIFYLLQPKIILFVPGMQHQHQAVAIGQKLLMDKNYRKWQNNDFLFFIVQAFTLCWPDDDWSQNMQQSSFLIHFPAFCKSGQKQKLMDLPQWASCPRESSAMPRTHDYVLDLAFSFNRRLWRTSRSRCDHFQCIKWTCTKIRCSRKFYPSISFKSNTLSDSRIT